MIRVFKLILSFMFFQKSEVKRVMNRMKRWKYFKSKNFNLFVGTPKISSMDGKN